VFSLIESGGAAAKGPLAYLRRVRLTHRTSARHSRKSYRDAKQIRPNRLLYYR